MKNARRSMFNQPSPDQTLPQAQRPRSLSSDPRGFASISAMKETMHVGIIGGGLMGREAASAFGRWFVLDNFPVQAELVAVCDLQEKLLDWFRQVPTVKLLTKDHQ